MSTINDTDLLLVNRGGVDYKITAQDLLDANSGGDLQSVTDAGNITTNGATFGKDLTINTVTVGQGGGDGETGNTAVGQEALGNNTDGMLNAALGGFALHENTTGNSNVAVGQLALYSNTRGSFNTAIGDGVMSGNITGLSNTAVGVTALLSNTDGGENTALGRGALYGATDASFNTAIGTWALSKNINGQHNTCVGRKAGRYIGGDNNTVIGEYEGTTADATLHDTVIILAGPTERLRIDENGNTEFYGELKADNVTFNLENGKVLDVKDRLTKTDTALKELKVAAAAATDFASLQSAIATALAKI